MPEEATPPIIHSSHNGKKQPFYRHPIIIALGIATGIAILLTTVSTWLYVASGTSTLDLSRPGYERERQEVKSNEDNDKEFNSTGEITSDVLKQYLEDYDKRTKEIGTYGNFTSSSLDDSELQLVETP